MFKNEISLAPQNETAHIEIQFQKIYFASTITK